MFMFGALRRCPATLSRHVAAAALPSRALRVGSLRAVSGLRTPATRTANTAAAGFHHSAKWHQIAAAEAAAAEHIAEHGPVTEFRELAARGLVHPNIVNVITKSMRLTTMTDVQTRTINEALSGVDVIAQAKTGTGKTLGFLVPTVQRIVQNDPKLSEKPRGYKRARADDIRAIIISPTRELAEQIAVEAVKVTSGTGLVVQTAVGGTQKRSMLVKTLREGCHILVGTPGRLYDILSDPHSGIKAPNLNVLVMDEADRLLDDGFTREIDEIRKFLPDPEVVPRQNLMFSATVPRDVVHLVQKTLRPGFHYAKCVNEDEEPTHQRVPQKFVNVTGFENLMPSLYELVLQKHQLAKSGDARPFKAIVYYNSTAEVTLAASVFYKLSKGFKRSTPLEGLHSYEIHAKLSQAQRTRAADDFRHCKSGILFSSDVTARGMDFPNVSHVIQIGLPRERESYIHRLGRTGRAGKEGEGWLFLSRFDALEVHQRLRNLPLTDGTHLLECATVDMSQAAEVPAEVGKILSDCAEAYTKVYPDQLDAAFRGLFGSFQWFGDKQALVEGAKRLAEVGWGMSAPPPVPASVFQGNRGRSSSRGPFGNSSSGGGQSGGRRGGFGGDRAGFGGGRGGFGGGRSGFGGDRGSDRGFGRDRGGDRGFGGHRGGDRSFAGDRSGGGSRGFGGGERRSGGFGGDRRGGEQRGGFGERREFH